MAAVVECTDLEQWVNSAVRFADDEDWYDGRVDGMEFPRFEGSSLRLALDQLGTEFANFDEHDKRIPVIRSLVAIGPGETRSCAEFGTYAIIDLGAADVVVWLSFDRACVMLYAVSNDADARRQAMDQLVCLATGSCSTWRGQVVLFDPTVIDTFRHLERPDVAEVQLTSELASELRRNIVVPIRHFDDVRSMVSSHGVLLFGLPGTGKTWATRWVQGQIADVATVVVATPAMFSTPDLMIRLFELAGADTPSLLIMEDLDVAIRSRFDSAGSGALGELLARLDGPGRVPGVFTVATTNHLAALDAALSERPGRFDRKIEVGDATTDARRAVLERLVDELGVTGSERDSTIQQTLDGTDGWTLAELTELGQLAMLDALDRNQKVDLVASIDLVHRRPDTPVMTASGYV